MPVTNLEDYEKLFKQGTFLSPTVGGAYTPVSPELGEWLQPTDPKAMERSLAAAIHGTAKGMTFGQSEKLLDIAFGPKAAERREQLAPAKDVEKTFEFAGSMVPITTGLKTAYALPWISRLPKVARAAVANALAGAGLGAVEQKEEDESRLSTIAKEAGMFTAIGTGLAGAAPFAQLLAKSKIPGLSKVAGWFVRTPKPPGFQERLRETYGEAAMRRAEAQQIGGELAGLSPAKQARAAQIMKGGITTQPEMIEVTEKPIRAFEEAGSILKQGQVLKQPYWQKLSEQQLANLRTVEETLGDRLAILRDVRDNPANKNKLFSQLRKMVRWKEKYRGRLRELRSLEKFKDVDLDRNMAEIAIEGLDDEIKFLQQQIKKPTKYKGIGQDIGQLETRLKGISDRIYTHYHEGGTRYFPRMYAPKEQQTAMTRFGFWKPFRFRGKRTYLKAREDIPDHIRKEMGEIVTAPYPTHKRLSQLSYDLAVFNLFDDVARNPEWSTTSAQVAKERGWVKLTKTPTWGLGGLRNSYVQPEIAETLNDMSRIRGSAEKAYDTILGAWKYSKVVPRPGTWSRNIFNNFIFADLAGVRMDDPKALKSFGAAIKDYVGKGPIRQELIKNGLLGTEYLPTEAGAIMRSIQTANGNIFKASAELLRKPLGAVGKFYTAQDQVFKQWIYTHYRQAGKNHKDALKLAFDFMPNYREVPRATQVLRRSPFGAPFFSFTSEALRIGGVAARENPLGLAKWLSLPIVLTEISKRKLGISEEEWNGLQREFPEYMRKGLHVLLPIGNKTAFRVLDMTYMMFYGDAIDYSSDPLKMASNPIFTAAAEAITGRDTFTGKPIVKHAKPTFQEKIQDWADYLYRDFGPALAPEIPGTGIEGGYDYMRWRQTLTGEPHPHTGRKTPLEETIASTIFGLKTREIRPAELEESYQRRKMGELYELETEFRRVASDLSLTEEERQRRFENIQKKIDQLAKELSP